MNETLFGDVCGRCLGADRDRTISTNHCFYLFSKNNFLSIYVKMYVKDFATPCFSPVLAKNRLTGNPFFSWSDSKSGQNREGCSVQNLLTCR